MKWCAVALVSLVGLPAVGQTVVGSADAGLAQKAPALVLLMRHAEKPLVKGDGDLSPVGFERADALPTLFLGKTEKDGRVIAPRFPKPDAIFATAPSKHSNRPLETVLPLGKAVRVKINAMFVDGDVDGLAKAVLSGQYAGKVVVISWHHGEIPQVARALGVTNEPGRWDSEVFDRIWKIEWVDGKAQMTDVPEKLLGGDSK